MFRQSDLGFGKSSFQSHFCTRYFGKLIQIADFYKHFWIVTIKSVHNLNFFTIFVRELASKFDFVRNNELETCRELSVYFRWWIEFLVHAIFRFMQPRLTDSELRSTRRWAQLWVQTHGLNQLNRIKIRTLDSF